MSNFSTLPRFVGTPRPNRSSLYDLALSTYDPESQQQKLRQQIIEAHYPAEAHRNLYLNAEQTASHRQITSQAPRPLTPRPCTALSTPTATFHTTGHAASPRSQHRSLLAWARAQGISPQEGIDRAHLLNKILPLTASGQDNAKDPIEIHGDLTVEGYAHLKALPQNLHVLGQLIVRDCARMQKLPERLHVASDLHLSCCPLLETLPSELTVEESFVLRSCPKIRHLPANLHIGRDWHLISCPQAFVWPKRLHVCGNMAIVKTQLSPSWLPKRPRVDGHMLLVSCSMETLLLQKAKIGQDIVIVDSAYKRLDRPDARIGGTVMIADKPGNILAASPDAPIYQYLQESLMLALTIWQREQKGCGFGQKFED